MHRGSIEWEHHPGEEFVLRFKPPPCNIIPEETKAHARQSRKEMLLALRSLIDTAITRMEEAEKKKAKKGRTKIEVE
jgi:hypothetical protein